MTLSSAMPVPDRHDSLDTWLDYVSSLHVSAIDMGLDRVRPVFDALGFSDINQSLSGISLDELSRVNAANNTDAPMVFTVAGTNGKGSTTATISAICEAAGYRTALYQSPHLLRFNERIQIDNQPVNDTEIVNALVAVEAARQTCKLSLSFFEMTTLAAFYIFYHAKCEVWVLEVGLGGRLDVVNLIDPSVAVITNVGIDHTDWLGDTREKIGSEKAGIIRPDIPVVYGEQDMPESIQHKVDECGNTLWQLGVDYSFLPMTTVSQAEASWVYSCASNTLVIDSARLAEINLATAISALLLSPLSITVAQINQGLSHIRLLGRFERQEIKGRQVVFDVGHNTEGVAFLLERLIPYWHRHLSRHPQAKLWVVFSMLADKPIGAVARQLADNLPIAGWLIAPTTFYRAADIDTLRHALLDADVKAHNIVASTDLTEAWHAALQNTYPQDMLLISGSFYTIKEIKSTLQASES